VSRISAGCEAFIIALLLSSTENRSLRYQSGGDPGASEALLQCNNVVKMLMPDNEFGRESFPPGSGRRSIHGRNHESCLFSHELRGDAAPPQDGTSPLETKV
jgi:hypothetical protein